MSLRSYEIIIGSYFSVRHKNRQKHNQHFRTTVFHNKFTLCHIKPNIYIYRNLNLPLTSSIYFVFLPLELQKKTRTDQSIPHVFLLCLKRNNPQAFESGSCKNSFLVYMLLLQLASMNVFYSM